MNHMKSTLVAAFLLFGLTTQANEKFKINIGKSNLKLTKLSKADVDFTQISVNGFETDKTLGAPELPVKSWLVKGTPEQIRVRFNVHATELLTDTKPYPTQEQDCRCETDKVKTFKMNNDLFEKALAPISVNYLGAYRGTHISQVSVRLGSYDALKNETQIVTAADVEINSDLFSLQAGNSGESNDDLKDYLIVVPSTLVNGISEFVNWKRSKGFTVHVETVTSPSNDLNALKKIIKQYYTEKGIDFVILVGDETAIPMFKVATSGSAQTPSDLKYFTMDGDSDYIPDVFASRIVASNANDVAIQLSKSIEFEQRSYQNTAGLKRFIGIASNEGLNPSDDEYVKSIEDKFKKTMGAEIVHLFQDDSVNSKPTVLNSSLNSGAFWLTYLGHGSGTAWPSMNQQYSVANINQIKNKPSVKPIIIDVACQNGRLVSNYLGTTFMKTQTSAANNALGAAAYYGGSVNISWHPPAVMARGIAYEHLAKKFQHLGQALLAGNLYLAASWNNQAEVIDNFEWYHLQGDPGMNIQF